MSTSTLTVLRCDRCGFTETLDDDAGRGTWGWVASKQTPERGPPAGGPLIPEDLCAGCLAGLMQWFGATSSPVTQPSIAPPKPKPAKKFSLEDRKRAVGRLVDVLREQVAASFAVILEQPTSILSGELVPGALAGIDGRAAEFVDDLLDRAGVRRRR